MFNFIIILILTFCVEAFGYTVCHYFKLSGSHAIIFYVAVQLFSILSIFFTANFIEFMKDVNERLDNISNKIQKDSEND